MKKIIVLFILLIGTGFVTTSAMAAKVDCNSYYLVKSGDTIRQIVSKYNVTAWDIIAANNRLIQRPNFPIYVGVKICIPKTTGNKRNVSATIQNQPAAETIIIRRGGKYYIYMWGWALGSNWWVKENDKKIGKARITTKNRNTISIPALSNKVCFKNQLTDATFCFPAR